MDRPESPLVSIVVPVYNKEARLTTSLESALTQTLQNIEVICVNDCSTDLSGEILQAIAEIDNRVRVIHHPTNEGAGAARNTGMKEARGKYIAFLDADDTFVPSAMEKAYLLCEKTNADICLFGMAHSHPSRNEITEHPEHLNLSMLPKKPDCLFSISDAGINAFLFACASACTKLFRRDFLEKLNLHFTNHCVSEDFLFVYTALPQTDKVTALDESLYIYDQETGAGATADHKKIAIFLEIMRILRQRIDQAGLLEKYDEALINLELAHLENTLYDAQYPNELKSTFGAFSDEDLAPFTRETEKVRFSNERLSQYYEFIRDRDPLAFAAYRFRTLQIDVVRERGRAEVAERSVENLSMQLDASRRDLDLLRRNLDEARTEIAALRNSHSYKVGNALMKVPSKIKHLAKDAKKPF